MFSKRSANLDEIVDGDGTPTPEQVLNSKDFQVNLINDLINNKRNIIEWKVIDNSGSINDLENGDDDSFDIDYSFDFKYNYKGVPVPLTLFINGRVDVKWMGKYISATYYNPPEYPQPEVDDKSLGKTLDISLFDDDGSEIGIQWLTPDLEAKVAKAIISPYL